MKQIKLAEEPDALTSYKFGVWYVWPEGARAKVMRGALTLQVLKKDGPGWWVKVTYPGYYVDIVASVARTKNAAMLAAEKWLYQQAHETLKFLSQRD
jgi:hypothetical protein